MPSKKWAYIGDKGLLSPGTDIVEMMTRRELSMGPELWPQVWMRVRSAINDIVQDGTRDRILWGIPI